MKRSLLFLSLFLSACLMAFAQDKKAVQGNVKDASGNPVPGITIQEKGTSNGAVSDGTGNFKLNVSPEGTLIFTGIGFTTQEVSVAGKTALNVVMAVDNKSLGEVVVTALGIKREKKSLGYALQEVSGESLAATRENNLANALTGKVAGLQITRSSNGPAGSSKIVLRGNNSLTGTNQPLIVVDGIPMDNFTGATNNDVWNPSKDMGNGLSDINPDDIESMSVLKGASAAALYGSRAGNGVILITTKSGKAQKGLGITYSSSVGFERIFTSPEKQTAFGQGTEGSFDNTSALSWGSAINGQTVTDWKGRKVQMGSYDNMNNFFKTGLNVKNSLSFQQQINATSIYTSITHLSDKSKIPGSKLERLNLLARAVSRFGANKRWTTDTKIQYIRSDAQNRPTNGLNDGNFFPTMYNLPANVDIRDLRDPKKSDGKMLWYLPNGNAVNPYWASQYNLNQDIRNRFLMSGSLKYEFTSWLNAEIKGGADIYNTDVEGKLYAGSPIMANGRYDMGKESFNETNFSALISAREDRLFGKLGGAVTLGGNLMKQKRSKLFASSGELQMPDLFRLTNGKNNPTITDEAEDNKRINSIFGTVGLNWDAYWFVDATFRNDWTSSLATVNRSFFYPSISTSLIVTEMVDRLGGHIPSWISYGKVRASIAQVGNDLPPYQLYNTFDVEKDPNGNTVIKRKKILFDPYVKNELITSREVGIEARFLKNRVGFDVALYKSNATNQLLDLPMDPLSGYSFRKVNAGNIENKGIEVMLNGRVLNNAKGLNWDVNVNFSSNTNTVKELTSDVSLYPLGGYDNVQIYGSTGQKYGEIWGTAYKRVTDKNSPYYGKLLLSENGLPQMTEEKVRLGNQQATALLGIGNSFQWKDFSFSFQVDARFGGQIYSATNLTMQKNGTAAATVRDGNRDNFVVDGVIFNSAKKVYEPSTIAVKPQRYWEAIGVGNLGITEANLYDASNIRLRNINFSYRLPAKLLSRTPIQRASIGFSCNNVWLISSHMNGIDPESVFATGTNAVGFESGSAPTSRTYLVNLSVSF